MTVAESALDEAAQIIGQALELAQVLRDPIGPQQPDEDEDGVGLLVALSEGVGSETGYCMGAARPFEFEHAAALEILVVGGSDSERRARRAAALAAAAAAIAADPTLGGLVDHAEIGAPDPSAEARYVAYAATLTLTYTAPDALG
ncbi:MAG TPA: hypothetical protein VEA80_06555 [Vitreimonas sp.]|uniref:hypothetical protein n=1 Tax=Vitreimonas sp. TaxID=3069702 RepID=UPI002D59EF79|nr:hypothetical protein [Vitreimonas sp.]HYD87114.1 hypothetical protein [Vitreimonas sp.]